MASKHTAAIWAAEAALLVLLAGAMLPIWSRWYVTSTEPWSHFTSLWDALIGAEANRHRLNSDAKLLALHGGNVAKVIGLLAIAVAVGCAVSRFRRTWAAVWGWGLLVGIVLVIGLVVIFAGSLRNEHLIPAILVTIYAAALLVAWACDDDSEAIEPSGNTIDRMIKLKRGGILLSRGRFHRERRPNRLAINGPACTSDSQLDRLVARKQQFGLSSGTNNAR